MGIMPADREQKWQSVIRRFGLPAEAPEKRAAADKEKPTKGETRGDAERRQAKEPGG